MKPSAPFRGGMQKSPSLQEIVTSPDFSTSAKGRLEELPLVPPRVAVDSVLIVPLGTSPMVTTQLYTLLQRQEGHTIYKVILVYPAQATEIANGANLIEKALQEEANIPCVHACVPNRKDIASRKACEEYQAVLEAAIDEARQDFPGHTLDLALSGGRKGMTAMTIFVAQNKGLPHVYHTLITDKQLSETIDEQTTVEALSNPGLSWEERRKRLFLRAYQREGADPSFLLFKVPVFPTDAH